jgi:ABC-type multidrug transport system fused ATPase/permease subunit
MQTKILAGMLLLMVLVPSALGLQRPKKRPTPKPAPSASVKPGNTPASPKPGNTPASEKPGNTPASQKPGNTSASQKKGPSSLADLVFTWPALIFLFLAGVVGFGLGAGVGSLSLGDNQAAASLRGLEAAILAVVGGLLARFFIAWLLWLGGETPAAEIAVGWFFFIVPGAIDTIVYLATGDVATSPVFLIWMGTIVGAFTGLMNGLWQIHNWKGIGWLALPLEVTWGLAGATTGSLLHLINFAWAGHAGETRREAHRYISGARFKRKFALTQGPVMSNLPDAPGVPLYHHERTHVWQNRAFGPLFSLSYLGWMGLWVIPGAIAAIITRDAEAIQSWCYFNNPWETWAYLVGAGPRTGRHPLIWSDLVILLLSIPFFGLAIALIVWIALEVW